MIPIPFDFPHPQIPFVMMAGETRSTPLKVIFDSGDAAPYAVLLGERSPAAAHAQATGEPAVTTSAVVGGGDAHLTPAVLPELRIGPIALSDVRVALSPSLDVLSKSLPGGVDAVIGYQFAAERVVAIDYVKRTIAFGAEPSPERASVTMTVTPTRPLTLVDVTINGKGPFRMAVDTGAGATLLSPAAAAKAGVVTGGAAIRMGGAGGMGAEAKAGKADLTLGATVWSGATVLVGDVLSPVSKEAGAEIDGVLGAPLFARKRLVLDYPRRRVWVGDSAS